MPQYWQSLILASNQFNLNRQGDPPALPGRQQQFDVY
jgi:hypothetical protein